MTERPFIQHFRLKDYRCVLDCALKLTRLHALIGPNDSGKSTLLDGLRFAQERIELANRREVSKTTQVVIATHSPLVINELRGEEISIITRDDTGTHATLLSETPRYAERSSVYKNGELWLGFGDPETERGLITGTVAT